jgi:hypothetical protein
MKGSGVAKALEMGYVTTRHGIGAVQPSPRAVSEGCARVGSQGHWSREEVRAKRMLRGLQNQ